MNNILFNCKHFIFSQFKNTSNRWRGKGACTRPFQRKQFKLQVRDNIALFLKEGNVNMLRRQKVQRQQN